MRSNKFQRDSSLPLQSMLKLQHYFLTEFWTLHSHATLTAGVRGFRGPTCKSKESSGEHPWTPCALLSDLFWKNTNENGTGFAETEWLALAKPYGGRPGQQPLTTDLGEKLNDQRILKQCCCRFREMGSKTTLKAWYVKRLPTVCNAGLLLSSQTRNQESTVRM